MRTSDCSSDVCSSDLGEYYRTGGRCRHPCVSAARAVFPWRRRDRRSSQNESFFGRCKCATEPVRLTILLAAHLLQPLHVEGQRLWRGPRVERAAREADRKSTRLNSIP